MRNDVTVSKLFMVCSRGTFVWCIVTINEIPTKIFIYFTMFNFNQITITFSNIKFTLFDNNCTIPTRLYVILGPSSIGFCWQSLRAQTHLISKNVHGLQCPCTSYFLHVMYHRYQAQDIQDSYNTCNYLNHFCIDLQCINFFLLLLYMYVVQRQMHLY